MQPYPKMTTGSSIFYPAKKLLAVKFFFLNKVVDLILIAIYLIILPFAKVKN